MKNNFDFAILGGDRRMAILAKMLENVGTCKHFLNSDGDIPERIEATATILPIPCSFDGIRLSCFAGAPLLNDVISHIYSPFVFGGRIPAEIRKELTARGMRVYDLLEDEALLIKNAQLTAEGALGIIIAETQRAVLGARITVIGFGRIGRALARILTALGARVTVAVRSDAQLAEAECLGCLTVPLTELPTAIAGADAVCNTAPAHVLGRAELAAFSAGVPFIELASGGFNASSEVRFINAQGLPGKTAPESAAQIIYDRITDLLLRQI